MRFDAHVVQIARPDIFGILLALGYRQDGAIVLHCFFDCRN